MKEHLASLRWTCIDLSLKDCVVRARMGCEVLCRGYYPLTFSFKRADKESSKSEHVPNCELQIFATFYAISAYTPFIFTLVSDIASYHGADALPSFLMLAEIA
jgi:hypothetical protein